MKTVAAISFLDNHSLSMDIEGVTGIEAGRPVEVADGMWVCEILVRSANGTVALQLLADSPSYLDVIMPPPVDE
jgi:hypothetical protein